MTNNDDIGRKLDSIAAILKLVHRDELDKARQTIRQDQTYAAILDSTKGWTGAAKVRAAAAKKGSARSTTSKKIVQLIDLGLLEKQGGGKTVEYKATGLI
jgi:hypothetical protein